MGYACVVGISASLPIVRGAGEAAERGILMRTGEAFQGSRPVDDAAKRHTFNGIGIPLAAEGLIHPIWSMIARAVRMTAIFINSLWGRPALFIDAILSICKALPESAVAPAT